MLAKQAAPSPTSWSCTRCATGSADASASSSPVRPRSTTTSRSWFDSIGLTILEGYGLTETSAASFVNRPASNRIGTVGWALPGTEAKIAEDGEVLLRGPGIMQGYHNKPEETAETKDAEGWLHTGDIGELDDRGYLRITDRKKDFFKTSSGKYVAPSMIESTLQGHLPLRQPVHGLRRRPQLRHRAGHARPGVDPGLGRQPRRLGLLPRRS